MKYKQPWNPNQNLPMNKNKAHHQNNPQPYLKPAENPPAYRPNLLNHTSKSQKVLTSLKSKIICHKCGLGNHYAKDCLAEIP